ncbi:DUF7146 domain-containing protein [Manganibacter manganicus]|uniref:DUF7146 domain-containing protein n=1 Tax=Manganibacter manganicus TaxID=1873176 RepID=UPI001FD9514B|nr:toprim domain-containing protein [Pseudaminobacter manganicus]
MTFTDTGFIVNSFADDDWKECRDHVKAVLGLSADRPVEYREPVPTFDPDRARKQKSAAGIWARSVPIAGTLAETYLRSRGLTYESDALRFHHGKRMMVAQITDAITGDPIGLHRTFLDHEGNRTGKMMLGAAAGGVVRLSADEDVTAGLAVAEGIETALAAPFRPVWACLSAGNMARFPVLAGIETLTIFADNDRSGTGERDAFSCAERWHAAGKEVEVRMLAEVGRDYADLKEAA